MSAQEIQSSIQFKLLIIGSSGVGKSCFLLQFTEGVFKQDHIVTIGVEYGAKNITINNTLVKLQIWDTAGQEEYRSITRTFYRNAHGIIIMYDITNLETFEDIDSWINEAKQNAGPDVSLFLVGNVLDLSPEEREVDTDIAEKYAAENKLDGFMETSAKTAENVTEVFTKFGEILYKKHRSEITALNPEVRPNDPGVIIRPTDAKKKKGCC
ncbi:unnamed protein product [Blepharisma stoltei]|uniref:Uncharacterized protein n=1 Tax=Blepharisma stoltei TaxID=1481888 RepID=A0AAU9K7M9_9CILI|nr:unnamed protein product [Blepharisma stoltei]